MSYDKDNVRLHYYFDYKGGDREHPSTYVQRPQDEKWTAYARYYKTCAKTIKDHNVKKKRKAKVVSVKMEKAREAKKAKRSSVV